MGVITAIEWTDHTFNPWWGCTKVSPGCDHCYAETFDKRVGGAHWGAHAERRTFGDKHWNEPLRWQRDAEKAGARRKVFCASMADVFDNRAPEGARPRLWTIIGQTPALDWLLLTKRPQNIDVAPRRAWLGTTTENQEELDRRWPHLRRHEAAVHFFSAEPLLGPLTLPADFLERGNRAWVICGGESGPGFRPMNPDWARGLRDQCTEAGVPFFFKQWGGLRPKSNGSLLDGIAHKEFPHPSEVSR